MTFKTEELRALWAKQKNITINGVKYRVGRMSYGDYFLEPGNERGEKDNFNPGTLWPERNKDIWTI